MIISSCPQQLTCTLLSTTPTEHTLFTCLHAVRDVNAQDYEDILLLQPYSALKIHQVRDPKLEHGLSSIIDHLCHYQKFKKDTMG